MEIVANFWNNGINSSTENTSKKSYKLNQLYTYKNPQKGSFLSLSYFFYKK